ncbi:MAG: hypothetical protein C0597_07340, partial [Marinilabiliales bacterium]
LSSFINISEEDKNNPNETVKPESNFFSNNKITDGPYIFIENKNIKVSWINGDKLRQKMIYGKNFKAIERKFGFEFKPEWIDLLNEYKPDYIQRYDNVKNFIAISDIHGQFDVLI